MTTQEAKFILEAYRPSGEDASDPQFTEALALAKLDPELSRWFTEQIAFDAAASRALKQVKVPAQLRESILAGQKIITPTIWWQRPAALAMAAMLALFIGLGAFWLSRPDHARLADFQRDVTAAATSDMGKHLGIETGDVARIQSWLQEHNAQTNYVVPAGLRDVAGMGCRVLDWNSSKVTMICYVANGNHVDLFVIDRNGLHGSVPGDKPVFANLGSHTTASWSDADKVYVLVGHGKVDEKVLRSLIEPQSASLDLKDPRFLSACLSLKMLPDEP